MMLTDILSLPLTRFDPHVTDVNKSLLNLHKVGEENNDPQLCDFVESEYLEEQVEAIKKIADLVTQLNRVGGDGLGRKFSFFSVPALFWVSQWYRGP